jgi:endonuclease YncB( thermonuclease family)
MRGWGTAKAGCWWLGVLCLAGCAITTTAAIARSAKGVPLEYLKGTVSYVTDGDTLWVRPDEGGAPRKIRIDGIDAPEICQAFGPRSRAALAQRVLHRTVALKVLRFDDYQRGLARVSLGREDVARWMVKEGNAWSYHYRRSAGPYAKEENLARSEHRGLFADPKALRPREFRVQHGSCE